MFLSTLIRKHTKKYGNLINPSYLFSRQSTANASRRIFHLNYLILDFEYPSNADARFSPPKHDFYCKCE